MEGRAFLTLDLVSRKRRLFFAQRWYSPCSTMPSLESELFIYCSRNRIVFKPGWAPADLRINVFANRSELQEDVQSLQTKTFQQHRSWLVGRFELITYNLQLIYNL